MENINNLIDKFPDGKNRFETNALFNKTLTAIAQGLSHYEAMNFLFNIIDDQNNKIKELIEKSKPAPILINKDDWENSSLFLNGKKIENVPLTYNEKK